MTTTPGFSSRSTDTTTRQFPQRDERHCMTEHAVETTIQGMDDHGWSNSDAVTEAPDDVHPDVDSDLSVDPGWSNGKAVKGAETKVVVADDTEDKSVAKKATARKTSTKKKS